MGWKIINHRELTEPFFGSLADKSVESSADNGGLASDTRKEDSFGPNELRIMVLGIGK